MISDALIQYYTQFNKVEYLPDGLYVIPMSSSLWNGISSNWLRLVLHFTLFDVRPGDIPTATFLSRLISSGIKSIVLSCSNSMQSSPLAAIHFHQLFTAYKHVRVSQKCYNHLPIQLKMCVFHKTHWAIKHQSASHASPSTWVAKTMAKLTARFTQL